MECHTGFVAVAQLMALGSDLSHGQGHPPQSGGFLRKEIPPTW